MVNSKIFTAQIEIPVGMSYESILQGQMNFDESKSLDTFKILWDVKQSIPVERFWVLGACDDISLASVDFRVDSESLVLTMGPRADDQLRVLELFSGGFGGWKFAIDT